MRRKKIEGDLLFKRLILTFLFYLLSFCAYSEELTIIYTGDSYANLYPCQECSASVGGGVTRRSAAIKALRSSKKNIILIDAGNFTAGGIFDSKSINPTLDRKRSRFYYKAMQMIDYDFVGLGENEFIFGEDFLKNSLAESKLKFVSSNLNFPGVKPYYISEHPKLKLGIIALSPKSVYQRFGFEINDYQSSLKQVIEEISSKVSVIILISPIGDNENAELAKEFPQINAIISSGPTLTAVPYNMIGNTFLFRPSYQAKELRLIEIEAKPDNTFNWKYSAVKLPLELKEDPQIASILPSCFKDDDCLSREGLISTCQNPAETAARCMYYDAKKIDSFLITDKDCSFCSTDLSVKFLKDNFLGLDFKILHYEEAKAKDIIERYKVKTLPFLVIDSSIKSEDSFGKFSSLFEDRQGSVLVKKELSGIFLFLERKEVSDRIDLFLDFYKENSANILEKISGFAQKNKIDLAIYFATPAKKDVGYPQEEITVALAVKEAYPKKLFDYLKKRIKNIRNTSWIDTADQLKIDYQKIKQLIKSEQMKELISLNNQLVEELGVNEGNVLLVNNRRIFKVFDIDPDDFEFKRLFTKIK